MFISTTVVYREVVYRAYQTFVMLTPALQVHTMPPQHINVNFNLMSLNYILTHLIW